MQTTNEANFDALLTEIRAARPKIAGRVFEKGGGGRFRDSVTICRNGRAVFERHNYGEAAGLVCAMPGAVCGGALEWDYTKSDYSGKTEAPVRLLAASADGLAFEGLKVVWAPVKDLKAVPKAGLGRLKVLLAK